MKQALKRKALLLAMGWGGIPFLIISLVFLVMLSGPLSQANEQTNFSQIYGVSDFASSDIPPPYLAAYQQAAQEQRIDWAVLAGLGKVETDHGRLNAPGVKSGVNTAGCCAGPMQFNIKNGPPSTWEIYGKANGYKNVYNFLDAIPAAARILVANGAPNDYRKAIYSYNHASWYVKKVLDTADQYRGKPSGQQAELLNLEDLQGSKLARIIGAADQLGKARIPYCYGGGHGKNPAVPTSGQYCWHTNPERKIYGSPDRGLDCSSSVSWVLQAAGYNNPTMTSTQLASWGQAGPGRHVTIWTNPSHVFLEINGRFWGTSTGNHRHGPGWHTQRNTSTFISRHPPNA